MIKLSPLTGDVNRDLQSKIDYFSGIGDKGVADIFKGLQNEKNSVFGGFKNDLIDQYTGFQNLINPSFNEYLKQNSTIANQILPGIYNQGDQINQLFGPNGSLYNEAESYYKQLMDATNNAASGSVASAGNMGVRAGASASAINQAINEARNAALPQMAKVQSEKLTQQQNLLNNYMQLNDALRSQQVNYSNKLITDPILQLNSQINTMGQNLINGLSSYDVSNLNNYLSNLANQQQYTNQLNLQNNQSNLATKQQEDLLRLQQMLAGGTSQQGVPVGTNADGSIKYAPFTQATNNSVSPNLLGFVKQKEGFNPNVYTDPAGVKTQGYGFTGNLIKGGTMSEEEASKILNDKINNNYLKPALAYINVPLKQNQIDAIASFAYNLGPGKVKDLAPYINSGDIKGAANQMLKYTYAGGKQLPGLVKRRQEEANMLLA